MQALAVLFVAFGSDVPAVTLPVVQMLPTADRHGTEMTTCPVPPEAIPSHEHVTVWLLAVHVAPDGAVVAGAGPVKRLEVAVKEMFVTSLGPRLVMTKVNVAVPLPALPLVTADAATERSATARTVPQACELLLPDRGSDVVAETEAVLQSELPSGVAAVDRSVSAKVALAPAARLAVVHVTVAGPGVPAAGLTHVHPAGDVRD